MCHKCADEGLELPEKYEERLDEARALEREAAEAAAQEDETCQTCGGEDGYYHSTGIIRVEGGLCELCRVAQGRHRPLPSYMDEDGDFSDDIPF